MRRDILARIQALEARKANTYVPPPPPPLSLYLVGYFGGYYDQNQSPRKNYALALAGRTKADGDDDMWRARAVRRFGKMSPEEVSEKHQAVWARILKRHKIDPSTMEPHDRLMRMLRRLEKAGVAPAASWGVTA
jgi:hypothetical protein